MVKALPSKAGNAGLIPGQGATIQQNIKQKQYGNKFNKDLKNGAH